MDLLASLQEIQAHETLLRNEQISKYIELAGLVILVADFLETLPLEVSLVWARKWKPIDVLFLICRYFAFFDIPILIYFHWNVSAPVSSCWILSRASTILYLVGTFLSSYLMFFRVHVLSFRSPWMNRYLIVQFVLFHAALIGITSRNLTTMTFAPPPIPLVSACVYFVKNRAGVVLAWFGILMNEVLLSIIGFWMGYQKHRDTKNPILIILYQDGVYYISLLTILAAANIGVSFLDSSQYVVRFFVGVLQRVLQNCLSTRMILHAREIAQKRFTPQYTIRNGVVMELKCVSDSSGP